MHECTREKIVCFWSVVFRARLTAGWVTGCAVLPLFISFICNMQACLCSNIFLFFIFSKTVDICVSPSIEGIADCSKDYECAAAPQRICLSHDLVADDRVSHPWRSHKTLSNWRNASVSHNLKPGKNSSCDVHLVEPGTTVLCRISTLTRQLAARLCVTVDTPASSRDLQRPGGEALKDLLLVLSEMWSLSFGPMTSSEDESRTPLSL